MEVSGSVQVFVSRYLYLFCGTVFLIALLLMMAQFSRKLRPFEVATISTLSAISVVGRIVFFFIPGFTPTTALIIISGSVYGPGVGCFIGALTALLSNVVFGQGTWTPFQMVCWGTIGLFSGLIRKKYVAIIYSIVSVMLFYGPVMNTYTMLVSGREYSVKMLSLFFLHGLPVDIMHTISTIVIICLMWNSMRKKLVRIRDKYGVLTKNGMYKEVQNV